MYIVEKFTVLAKFRTTNSKFSFCTVVQSPLDFPQKTRFVRLLRCKYIALSFHCAKSYFNSERLGKKWPRELLYLKMLVRFQRSLTCIHYRGILLNQRTFRFKKRHINIFYVNIKYETRKDFFSQRSAQNCGTAGAWRVRAEN